MKIKTLIVSVFLFLSWAVLEAAPGKTAQEIYIERYAPLAVSEMYRSGIPASITLAQGLLESGYGLSELAVKGNNHFGIKCHNNWKGGKMYHNDDRRGECFRKYASPEQSYRDHSDFLRYRERYRFLFDYRVTDYKSWAHGLKKAGYATDRAYPRKLIQLIEDYDLHQYDRKPASFGRASVTSSGKSRVKASGKSRKSSGKVVENVKESVSEIPVAPSQIENSYRMTDEQRADFHFSMSREVFMKNGVPFVTASEGDSYGSIAAANRLFLREILKFNDQDREKVLSPGTVVYLQPKKKQAVKGLEKHVVEAGESMWSISQRYGVRLKSLYKMNGMTDMDVPGEGDIIKLRK